MSDHKLEELERQRGRRLRAGELLEIVPTPRRPIPAAFAVVGLLALIAGGGLALSALCYRIARAVGWLP